jgi:hypothetical protein
MWKTFFFFLLTSAFTELYAQNANIGGLWKGTITQNSGGYRPKYDFEIFLHQKGDKISGRSYVFVENIYAVLELSGVVSGNSIQLYESRIVDSRKTEGLEWCIKSYDLVFSSKDRNKYLNGTWKGYTNGLPCIPGNVVLVRKFSRA